MVDVKTLGRQNSPKPEGYYEDMETNSTIILFFKRTFYSHYEVNSRLQHGERTCREREKTIVSGGGL